MNDLDRHFTYEQPQPVDQPSEWSETLAKRMTWIIMLGLAWGIALGFVALGVLAVRAAW